MGDDEATASYKNQSARQVSAVAFKWIPFDATGFPPTVCPAPTDAYLGERDGGRGRLLLWAALQRVGQRVRRLQGLRLIAIRALLLGFLVAAQDFRRATACFRHARSDRVPDQRNNRWKAEDADRTSSTDACLLSENTH